METKPEMPLVLINNVIRAERSMYLQESEYERNEDRKGHANGYKSKTVRTHISEITFAVSQFPEGGFYPLALETGGRPVAELLDQPGTTGTGFSVRVKETAGH